MTNAPETPLEPRATANGLPGWTPSPWFLVTAPERQEGVVRRSRVTELLRASVERHRITAVTAPAGFGKTVALSTWARDGGTPVAWLTLSRFDDDPRRLLSGVVSALRRLADTTADPGYRPLLTLSPDPNDLPASFDALCRVLGEIEAPTALVIDDAHLAGAALSGGALGALVDHTPPTMRIILASKEQLRAPLSRLLPKGSANRIQASDLAFTGDEIAAAAVAFQRHVTPVVAEEIRQTTQGWPVAVRLALAAEGSADGGAAATFPSGVESGSLLVDYVEDEVLGLLRPELAEFVLATTTCTRVDHELAAALSNRPDSTTMLEECMRRGLFLDRFSEGGSAPVYRWHSVFADRCREILRRRDQARVDRLNRIAAERLAGPYPLEAVVHALRGGAADLAVRTIASRWLDIVVRSHEGALNRLCLSLPKPWVDDPEILLIRACCLDLAGDRTGAAMLYDRGAAALGDQAESGGAALTHALAELFLADDHPRLMAAADRADALVRSGSGLDPTMYACTLFLLGWTELRLRRDPPRAVRLLQSAIHEGELTGQPFVVHRAAANLSFALAYGGRFEAARSSLARLPGPTDPGQAWYSYDGGVESMAEGFVAYWQDDIPGAEIALRRVVAGGGGPISYAALARIYLAFAACATRDRRQLAEAETELRDGVSDGEFHGVPWGTYKQAAFALIAEARGRTDVALTLARRLGDVRRVPVTTALLAGIFRRAGDFRSAAAMVGRIEAREQVSFVRTSMLLTAALIRRESGQTAAAHRLIEASLDVAVTESIARPFGEGDPRLRELLVEHAAWGTRHETFLAARIAWADTAAGPGPVAGSPLSAREREILGFLRTPMTTVEIAAALHLSVNTVKSHQRSIYRKLGVTSRRDAVRVHR